jgi:hypothetical protein
MTAGAIAVTRGLLEAISSMLVELDPVLTGQFAIEQGSLTLGFDQSTKVILQWMPEANDWAIVIQPITILPPKEYPGLVQHAQGPMLRRAVQDNPQA